MAADAPDPSRWRALALICVAFFMTVLDVSIVNVALPSIEADLDVRVDMLQWVVTAYAITFGGFLLLGGRVTDLLGRRRLFLVGVVLFTLASLACGLSGSIGPLIGARAAQGLGAAIITPATLSLITTTFAPGHERNKAVGIWSAMGGAGAAAGVLFGGVLTDYLGWQWIFFVNVPVGALVLVLAPSLLRESRIQAPRTFDVEGALTVTGGLALAVLAISRTEQVGWGSAQTIGELVGAAALLLAFAVIEHRRTNPIMPLAIFRVGSVAGANVVALLLGATVFANFFLLTLYVQQVLGYSPLKTGLTFLITAATVIAAAALSETLVTRLGVRAVLAAGMAMITGGMIWYTRISPHGSFARDLLGGYLLVGLGMAFTFIPVSLAALAGVDEHDAGLASGLFNASRQVGGAIGVAVAGTVSLMHASSLLEAGKPEADALTSGFSLGFWVVAAAGAGAILASLTMIRNEPAPEAKAVGAA